MNNENEYKKLTPFKMQVLETFPFIDADFDAITNYELLCKVVEYLNTTIENVDLLNEKVDEFQQFFDNLDLQDEVDKKLDEMAQDGSLLNLIKGYIDPIYSAYETEINNNITNINNKVSNQDAEILNFKTSVNTQVETINSKVDSATSGSPKGVYATVSDLETADPSHNYIYVVTADGKWYYYNTTTSSWTAGGTYQSSSLDDNTMSKIESNSIAKSKMYNSTYELNNLNIKAGYAIQNITLTSLDVVNASDGYKCSTALPIPVRANDKLVINQPVAHPLKVRFWIQQPNGIVYYNNVNNFQPTELYIPMTGDLYIEFQNGTNHITASDVLSVTSIVRNSDYNVINESIEDVASDNLEYLKYLFSTASYNTNSNTLYVPERTNGSRIYTTSAIHLPFDLKISLPSSKTWDYQFLVSYYSSNQTVYANQLSDLGALDAGSDVIIPANSYAVVGLKNTSNSTFNPRDIIPYLIFEKIDKSYKPKEKYLLSINHRGYGSYPENTIIAYKKDYIEGFDSVECDVRKTSDGKYVLLHDASINRIARNADGTELSTTINIANITYAQALTYDFGIYKGQEFAGTKIGTLEELLQLCRDLKLHICMELESGALNATDVSNIIDLVYDYNMQNNVLIMSANFGLCKNVVNKDKHIDVGYVNWNSLTSTKIFSLYSALKTPYNRMYFIDDITKYESHLSYYKTYNANVIVWTADTEEDIIGIDPYINGIESNYLVASKVLKDYNISN